MQLYFISSILRPPHTIPHRNPSPVICTDERAPEVQLKAIYRLENLPVAYTVLRDGSIPTNDSRVNRRAMNVHQRSELRKDKRGQLFIVIGHQLGLTGTANECRYCGVPFGCPARKQGGRPYRAEDA